MATRRHIGITAAFITVLFGSSAYLGAGELGASGSTSIGSTVGGTATAHKPVTPKPRISERINSRVANKLEIAFDLALERLEEHPECRSLFVELDSDGTEMLSTTLYYPAALKLERDLCCQAEGYTTVGGAPTWLCRRFSKLPDQRAAMVLIHEALHHAGLGERPLNPDGPSSHEINDMVTEACRL